VTEAVTELELGSVLLAIARGSIGANLGLDQASEPRHDALARPGATFVTLKQEHELRGCIGSLQPLRPLGVDVRENALAAAFRDPRFPPLAAAEFETTTVEVSLLSTTEPVEAADEQDLIAQLRPGVDGVILEFGQHRATFLPQVWESLDQPRAFLAALKRKAGLPEGFWNERIRFARYRVTKWTERDFLASEAKR
jgi:AmmeMemoRadiSam system protein A